MKVFLSLCLLFSLVTPAVLLTCEKCDNKTGIECSSRVNQDCSDPLVCKSAVMNGTRLFSVSRARYSCMFKNLCDPGHYAVTTANGVFFDMLIDCCKSNRCNSKELELPLKEMEPNEVECVGCYSKNKEKCEGTEVVKCRGDQTKCIKMTMSYRRKASGSPIKLTVKGCATPDMCQQEKVMRNRHTTDLLIQNMTAKCTDAF